MNILDLQEAGITFQGPVLVSEYAENGEQSVLFFDTLYNGFEVAYDNQGYLEHSWLCLPIDFVFVGSDGALHIEVKEN